MARTITTHSENTVYSWSPTTGQEFINGVAQPAPGDGAGGSANRIFETVWDGNGVDTYDLSNYSTGVTINLNPGASSITSPTQIAYLGNGHYAQGNIYTRFLASDTVRNGEPAALASDIIDLMDALKIGKATIAGFDWGARTANIIAALWPERCKAMVSVRGYLIGSQESGKAPLSPQAELQWWYQFYFATERRRFFRRYRCRIDERYRAVGRDWRFQRRQPRRYSLVERQHCGVDMG